MISALEYKRLIDYIRLECGIIFTPSKRTLIETRVGRRARALGMDSLSAYCSYLHSREGRAQEGPRLIDEVTTHKTDFFREPAHFDFLTNSICPELSGTSGVGIRRPLRVWCAASSTGEEPYTLAMVLSDYALSIEPSSYRFQIEATDVSTGVLEKARAAVYTEAVVAPVSKALRQRYLLRSKDPSKVLVRVVPELRALVRFRTLNLMDSDYGFSESLDVVFCRNVMIYFDRPTQHQILSKIVATLGPSRYLVMGHSESLNGMDLPIEQVAPTVYRRRHA